MIVISDRAWHDQFRGQTRHDQRLFVESNPDMAACHRTILRLIEP